MDSKDRVGDSEGPIKPGEGLAICPDCEILSLFTTLLEGTLISEVLNLVVSVGETGVEGEGVSLEIEACFRMFSESMAYMKVPPLDGWGKATSVSGSGMIRRNETVRMTATYT